MKLTCLNKQTGDCLSVDLHDSLLMDIDVIKFIRESISDSKTEYITFSLVYMREVENGTIAFDYTFDDPHVPLK